MHRSVRELFVFLCLGLCIPTAFAEPPEVLEARGRRGSVTLDCLQPYGVKDNRIPATPLRRENVRQSVYYFFSNEDLVIWDIEIVNGFQGVLDMTDPAGQDWLASLQPEFRDVESGALLPVELELMEAKTSRIVAHRDGQRIEELELGPPTITGGTASILTPYDNIERIYTEIERSFPDTLAPLGSFRIRVRSRIPNNVAQGAIQADFYDPLTDEHCNVEKIIVLGEPVTKADIVDDHLVRFNYFMAEDLHDLAEYEIKEATRKVPNSLTAWAWRAHFSAHVDDTEGYLESARKLEELLRHPDDLVPYDKHTPLSAREFIRAIPRLEQELLQKQEGKEGAGPRGEP